MAEWFVCARSDSRTKRLNPMNPPKLHTARILLLDDDPFMLKILRHQLAQLSYTQVEAFDSGEKALEQLNSSKAVYDLIFLDINS
jgi:CheY-like chemotaxis protein